jgi:hypothetical protein
MRAKEFIIDGIGGQFISGMTGGQASSLKDLGKLGAAAVGDKLGFKNSASNIRATIDPDAGTGEISINKIPPEIRNMSVKQLTDALGIRVGNTTILAGNQIKVTAIDSDGIDGTDLKSHMPVNYPKLTLAVTLFRQQQQQGQQ